MENQSTKQALQITDLLPQAVRPSGNFNISDDEVELTEEELQKLIRKAKAEKAAKLRTIAYTEMLSKPLEYPKISARDLGRIIKRYAESIIPNFTLDQSNLPIFKLLCQYFTQDPEFEQAGYSLSKGIMLFGNIGCGKTTLMRLFQRNATNDFVVKSCREVADAYSKNGPDTLYLYSNVLEVYPHEHYGQKTIGRCFDDLGTEKDKKYFGNEINVMEDILLNAYDNRLIGKIHLTTNLTGDEIGEVYGPRVRSRLREMCNIIAFDEDAQDRRK